MTIADNTAPDARANCDINQVLHRFAAAEPPFTHRRKICIVAQHNRKRQLGGDPIPQRKIIPAWQIWHGDDHARFGIQRAGRSDANPANRRTWLRGLHGADQIKNAGDHRFCTFGGVGANPLVRDDCSRSIHQRRPQMGTTEIYANCIIHSPPFCAVIAGRL